MNQNAPSSSQAFSTFLASIGARNYLTPEVVYASTTENGVKTVLPPVVAFTPAYETLDGAAAVRTQTGVMMRNILRQGVVQLRLSWANLTAKEMFGLAYLLKPGARNNGTSDAVWITFPSPTHNGYITVKCYCDTPAPDVTRWLSTNTSSQRFKWDAILTEY